MQHYDIRPKRDSDHATIRRVTEAAFRGLPYAGGDEHVIIDRLRPASALAVSLVALTRCGSGFRRTMPPASGGSATPAASSHRR